MQKDAAFKIVCKIGGTSLTKASFFFFKPVFFSLF